MPRLSTPARVGTAPADLRPIRRVWCVWPLCVLGVRPGKPMCANVSTSSSCAQCQCQRRVDRQRLGQPGVGLSSEWRDSRRRLEPFGADSRYRDVGSRRVLARMASATATTAATAAAPRRPSCHEQSKSKPRRLYGVRRAALSPSPRVRQGLARIRPDATVFTRDRRHVLRIIYKAGGDAGLNPDCMPKVPPRPPPLLRRLLSAGVPTPKVAAILRHATANVTTQVYRGARGVRPGDPRYELESAFAAAEN
jgi:hypothetical protein